MGRITRMDRPSRIITAETLPDHIFGSLAWSGIEWSAAGVRMETSIAVYRRVVSAGFYHLPFHLVFDFYGVLSQGFEVKFRAEGETDGDGDGSDPEPGRRVRMRYERECLGRLLQAPDVTAAMEIAQTSPQREACLGRLLVQLMKHFAPLYPKWIELNPGLLRDAELSFSEIPACDDSGGTDRFGEALGIFIAEVNDHVRWGSLLHEEDRFELAHLEALVTDHLRVGCRQIVEVSRRLANLQPLRLDLASHEGDADTAFLDETHYPTGGLSGLANRGTMENLVTSELAYLDESAGGVSLFDLRHAEGELLFYLRDSGTLRRKRRTIHFILDAGEAFEMKHRGYDYQYSVLIQGMCLRLLHDLFEIFETDALRFHFHYLPTGGAPEFLEAEIGMMRTVLADYVKHDWVRLSVVEGDAIDLDDFIDPVRKSYAVIFTGTDHVEAWRAGIEALAEDEAPLFSALVEIGGASDAAEAFQICLPQSGLELSELSRRKDAVLETLVG